MIPIPKMGSILAIPSNLPPTLDLAGLLDIARLCLTMLAFGGIALVVVLMVRMSKVDRTKTEASIPPENDAEAVAWALDVLGKCREKFYQAFNAMSDEDRIAMKGAQIAYICNRMWQADDQLDDALFVARGGKIVTMAEPETRACVLELIKIIEDTESDPVIVAGPAIDPKPTL